MNKNELDRLKVGTIIRNKKDKQWCFIVSQVFPDKIIAVRTIGITDHKEWEIVENDEPTGI